MGEPFVGEIRMFGGNFPPSGWAFCNGQLMPISENGVAPNGFRMPGWFTGL